MTPAELASAIVRAARYVATERGHDLSAVPCESDLRRPRNPGHGDYTSTVALRMASRIGDRPEVLANAIVARLVAEAASRACPDRGISFEVVPPGFVNIRLRPVGLGELAHIVVSQGRAYGCGDRLAATYVDLAGECDAEPDCPWESSEARGPRAGWADGWSLAQANACLVRRALQRIFRATGATVAPCGVTENGKVAREGAVTHKWAGVAPCSFGPRGSGGRDVGRVSFGQLVAVAGLEAARYHLVRSVWSAGVVPVDLDRLARHVPENPAYYVRYVAAMAVTTVRNAQAAGATFGVGYQPDLLVHERELALLTALRDYPWVVETSAELRLPHQVARYLEGLAAIYHDFSDCCRLRLDGDEVVRSQMRARLWLHAATRVVFANGLALLGVSAPDRL